MNWHLPKGFKQKTNVVALTARFKFGQTLNTERFAWSLDIRRNTAVT